MHKPISLLMNSRGKIAGVVDADKMRAELESMFCARISHKIPPLSIR